MKKEQAEKIAREIFERWIEAPDVTHSGLLQDVTEALTAASVKVPSLIDMSDFKFCGYNTTELLQIIAFAKQHGYGMADWNHREDE